MPKRKILIEIINLRNEKTSQISDFKIDRSSTVGNPFNMLYENEKERNRVCDCYEIYFYEKMEDNNTNSYFPMYIKNLIDVYKKYNKLRLFCWCSPKRCHGETIRSYIIQQLKK